jgi:hypothetical protein
MNEKELTKELEDRKYTKEQIINRIFDLDQINEWLQEGLTLDECLDQIDENETYQSL